MSRTDAPSRPRDPCADVRKPWKRFLDTYEPLRPDLYRFCRHLTRSAWDAEDIVQEALARAFVTLGCMAEPPQNPRAWLFRVATNLWLNQTRQLRERPAPEGSLPDLTESGGRAEPRAPREAAGTLLAQLSSQERAAVVLKDAFGLSLEEVAEALATTPGAIKAALHRGRDKLVAPDPEAGRPVPPAVLDAFCDAFNARDLDRLTALLLDSATMEFPGLRVEYGAAAMRAGSLRNTLFGCPEGGYPSSPPPRSEVRAHRGEPVLLWWWGDEVHAVVRVELEDQRIARLRDYHHAPDVLAEVCREMGVPYRTHGYWPEGPG